MSGDQFDKEQQLPVVWARAGRLLRDIYTPPKWSVALASKALAYMGYSCPPNIAAPKRIFNTVTVTSNYPNISVPMGLMSDNHLGLKTDTPSGVDDMLIENTLGRQVIVGRVLWTATDPRNFSLMRIPVGPGAMCFHRYADHKGTRCQGAVMVRELATNVAISQGSGDLVAGHMAWFLSQLTGFWRGTIKYKLVVPKNMFYAGRLALVYVPHYADRFETFQVAGRSVGVNMGLAAEHCLEFVLDEQSLTAHACIMDLAVQDECELEVPFTCHMPWAATTASTGMIYVKVVSPLVVTDTLSTDRVTVLLMANTTDMKFSVPMPALVNPGSNVDSLNGHQWFAQSGPEEQCMGEALVSLKQLISKPCMLAHVEDVPGFDAEGKFNKTDHNRTINCPPFWHSYGVQRNTQKQEAPASSYHSLISACYAYARGGTRYVYQRASPSRTIAYSDPDHKSVDFVQTPLKTYMVSDAVTAHYIPRRARYGPAYGVFQGEDLLPPDDFYKNLSAYINDYGEVATMPTHIERDGILDFTVPYQYPVPYMPVPYISRGVYTPALEPPIDVTGHNQYGAVMATEVYNTRPLDVPAPIVTINSPVGVSGRVYMSAADDAQLIWFLGPPPLVVVPDTFDGAPLLKDVLFDPALLQGTKPVMVYPYDTMFSGATQFRGLFFTSLTNYDPLRDAAPDRKSVV